MSEGRSPTVSVVIPTYNRRERLHAVLTGLADQTYRSGFETVVVSDGSDDGTEEYLRGDRVPLPVVADQQVNSGPAAARNRGVALASGDLIVFLDDDVVPTPTLVAAHVAAHAPRGDRAVVIGPMLNPPDHEMSMWISWEQAMLAKQYAAMERGAWQPTARQFYTGNASLYRRHLETVGGFDTSFRRAEDVELAYRLDALGLDFVFDPGAAGLHYAERSFDAWRATGRAYGRNDVVFARDRGQPWILEVALDEYRTRKWPIRSIVRIGVGRRRVTSALGRGLVAVARLGERGHVPAVSRAALSGIYNLAYYDGVAEELGGRRAFWRRRRDLLRAAASDRDADADHAVT